MPDVRYRPLRKGDFRALAGIVGEFWHDRPDKDEQLLLGAIDLATCLRRSTHSQVVLVEGCPAGLMLVRAGDSGVAVKNFWQRAVQEAFDSLYELDPDLFDQTLARSEAETAINARLLQESGCDERFEIVLFILASDVRGRGIGCDLFAGAEDYLIEKGAHEAFLYTDESCDWSFYEHRGLRRAAERHPTPGEGGLLSGYYLYVDDLIP